MCSGGKEDRGLAFKSRRVGVDVEGWRCGQGWTARGEATRQFQLMQT